MSIEKYLDSLRAHGHTPGRIGTVRIGRTTYAAGEFITPERDISPSCRAYAEGQRKIPAETRIALLSTADRVLPPSHDRGTVYVDASGQEWYVIGWHTEKRIFWLGHVDDEDGTIFRHDRTGRPFDRMRIDVQLEKTSAS